MRKTVCKQAETGGSTVMKKTQRILMTMLALMLAMGLSAAICAAQQPAATKEPAQVKPEAKERIVVKGKIAYMKDMGYYLTGEDQPGEYIIVNPNEKKLKSLMKQKKIITAEGYLTMGADLFFIEKIDGKKYRGDGKPAAK
jgi:hypothetical protein